jgi:hypothetical protein
VKGYSVTMRATRKMHKLAKRGDPNIGSLRRFVRAEYAPNFSGLSPKLQKIVNGGDRG